LIIGILVVSSNQTNPPPKGLAFKMRKKGQNVTSPAAPIDDFDTTTQRLTGRAGLALFSRYLTSTGFLGAMSILFASMRKSGKGIRIGSLLRQILLFMADGTSRHMTYFDELRGDTGYAGVIETPASDMVSSHQVKRFFAGCSVGRQWLFRRLIKDIFVWRLRVKKPDIIVLGIDTMVMDNSEADVREGVQPTYKHGVKGFQPLHVTWGKYIVDAVFRGGKKHSNHGTTVLTTTTHLVELIRRRYRDVPILFRMDAGFFDQKIMAHLEDLGVGYLVGGKIYGDLRERVDALTPEIWQTFESGARKEEGSAWNYCALDDCRKSWNQARAAIFMRKTIERRQRLLPFAQTESVIYTNVLRGTPFADALLVAGLAAYLDADALIRLYHDRGADELVHRALKDFAAEELPFKRFAANAAFYYMTLVAFALFEAFREDVVGETTSYATRVRRRLIDVAAKIVRTGHRTIIKITEAASRTLDFRTLWYRSAHGPPFVV